MGLGFKVPDIVTNSANQKRALGGLCPSVPEQEPFFPAPDV